MDAAAATVGVTEAPVYPLAREGERFPFLAPGARGIFPDPGLAPTVRYAACLQGTAMVERLAYEVIDRAAGLSGGDVFTTGGGSRSDIWTQIRADATGRTIHRPACPESAFGCAVLAAAGTVHQDLWQAAAEMVRIETSFVPNLKRRDSFETLYGSFRACLQERGWI